MVTDPLLDVVAQQAVQGRRQPPHHTVGGEQDRVGGVVGEQAEAALTLGEPVGGQRPLRDIPPGEAHGVPHFDTADVVAARFREDLVGVHVVVKDQRLTGVHGLAVHVEQPRAAVAGQQLHQARPDQLLARHLVVLHRGVIGVDIEEVDDRAVVVAYRFEQHVGVEHGVQYGYAPGMLGPGLHPRAHLGIDVAQRHHQFPAAIEILRHVGWIVACQYST